MVCAWVRIETFWSDCDNRVSTERKTNEGIVYFTSEVRPAADLQKLHVGDRIEGRIVVEPHNVYVTDVRIIR